MFPPGTFFIINNNKSLGASCLCRSCHTRKVAFPTVHQGGLIIELSEIATVNIYDRKEGRGGEKSFSNAQQQVRRSTSTIERLV
jgi:hypothetical protein